MSFFKHLLRAWLGGGYSSHRGNRRSSHHGGYAGDSYSPTSALVCGKCNATNDFGARFCAQCGALLHAMQCAACATKVSPGDRFCPKCGQAVGLSE